MHPRGFRHRAAQRARCVRERSHAPAGAEFHLQSVRSGEKLLTDSVCRLGDVASTVVGSVLYSLGARCQASHLYDPLAVIPAWDGAVQG